MDGGDRIRAMDWDDVSSILQHGGTVIGTARSLDFREREGRRKAVLNLIRRGIDKLIVIGGDGSLTGADLLRSEWASLLDELVERGELDRSTADLHPALMIAGLVGSIDNDMVGTDMTIGADSALHRIVEAIDAVGSTAASHQRSFVIEVMGRHCGYLALMSAIAGGADYVLIPENPPPPGWEDRMCELLRNGRQGGPAQQHRGHRRGRDRFPGQPDQQRARAVGAGGPARRGHPGDDPRPRPTGGAPSAYDRSMPSILGYHAVEEVLSATPESIPQLIGIRYNRVAKAPLVDCVAQTREVSKRIAARDFKGAMELRGSSYQEMVGIFKGISEALPSVKAGSHPSRIGIVNVGGLAPGMNAAARAAVRLGLDRGHTMVGIHGSFQGLIEDDVAELQWGDVEGWTGRGGTELGISRQVPTVKDFYAIGRGIERQGLDALLIIGGWDAFNAAHQMHDERERYPAFKLPMIVLPATIDNNIPNSELSVGSDTALNLIVDSIDRIRQTGTAAKRCFVIEVMGGFCGYLATLGGLSGGAVRVYLHEEGITLKALSEDVDRMVKSFKVGQRLFLAVRNEKASPMYSTDFLCRLFEQESQGLFDAREVVLGHIQQGGNPTPFDRILATRLASHSIDFLSSQIKEGKSQSAVIGLTEGRVRTISLRQSEDLADWEFRRPTEQWWEELGTILNTLAARLAVVEPETV